MRGFAICCAVLFLSSFATGCGGAGKTMVLDRSNSEFRTDAVTVAESPATVPVPDAERDLFRKKINEALFDKGAFRQGSGLAVNYRIVQFNAGSQFDRYMWGGIGNAGEGSMTVEVTYNVGTRSSSTPLARTQVEGHISSGMFGGSFEAVYDQIAKEIQEFATKNFKGNSAG